MIAIPSVDRHQSHPAGLYVLAFAEGAERGGFYLLLALFTLFLTESLGFSKDLASEWYGNYTAAAYLSALVGGWVAGRWGQRRQWIVFGAVLLGLGYWMMGHGRSWLGWSVALLVVGNSLFKPNISSLVGTLYAADDSRRKEGYALFYFAINLGGFLAPFAGEYARGRYGWTGAFGVAAGALVLSNIILLVGWSTLPNTRATQNHIQLHESDSLALAVERRQLARALTILLVCSVALVPFWAVFQQNGSALTFWARDNTIRVFHLRGATYEIPPGVFAAVNPLMVCLLSLRMSRWFESLRHRGVPITTGWQLLLGVVLAAAGCFVMFVAAKLGGDDGRVSQVWLNTCYFLHSCGELCLSPVGLAMVSQIAPPRHAGLLMGVWFGITALGNKLAGVAGSQWDHTSHSNFFLASTLTLLGSGLLLLLCMPWLNKRLPAEVQ